MPRISRTCLTVTFLALAGLPLTGCGGSAAKPKGQVLQDGQPYKLADGEVVTITFTSTEGKGTASATVAQDGSFTVQGEGLAPGSYTVNVISNLTKSKDQYADKFSGAFTGPNDPLKVDIGPEASPTLDIDLGKKTVTKK